MRKEAIIKTAIWMVYTFIISIIFFNIGYSNALGQIVPNVETPQLIVESPSVMETTQTPQVKFEIKDAGGKIAVYQGETLIRLTEISVSTLRREDVNKLREGIVVETIEEVQQILEDYSS